MEAGARQKTVGTAIIHPMLRLIFPFGLAAAMMIPAAASARDDDSLVRIAWVTDGDMFRLESGERIRIARIDAPETQRDQAKCAGEVGLGLRKGSGDIVACGARGNVPPGRPQLYSQGSELVRIGVAAWWPRGRPKPD